MQKKQQDSKNTRFLWLGGLALAAVSAAAAISLCSMRVDIRKQEVLESYGSSVSAWLEGTASSVALWEDEQRALRLRISDSETYRLFAGDLYGLDAPSAEKAPFLADDVPAIRRLLKEYMDFSGLNDARIIGSSGSTLLSSQSAPAPLSALQQKAAQLVMASGKPMRLPVRGSTSGLMLDVFEPVRSLEGGEPVAAAFMSSHPVLPSLAQFSARPKPEELSESFFLQRNAFASSEPGASWELLMAPKPRALDSGTAHELEKSGGELALALRPSVSTLGSVYSAARAVPGSGWSVILETPAAVLEERMFRAALPVYFAWGLGWAAFMLFFLLVWWMGIGRRQRAVAQELRELHQLVSLQKEFLTRVKDSLDMGLLMVDVKGGIHVCNATFAALVQRREEELAGQRVYDCMSPQDAAELVDHVRRVALEQKEDSFEIWHDAPGGKRLFRVSLSPYRESAETERAALSGAVVTMKDVTEFRRRAERARLQQKRLIEAFTSVEASADPYLHGFSRRMADLAERLAAHMGLEEDSRTTAVMGAQLSQLGKFFVPRELLTKQGRLTDEEMAELRRAPEHAARMLEGVDFDLPVARTLHEMYENLDGSGYPRGLKGEEILFEARFLAVLNAYCAMVSDRAYRQGMSSSAALAELRGSPRFDQRIVSALEQVLSKGER